jgi:hypothetical protein
MTTIMNVELEVALMTELQVQAEFFDGETPISHLIAGEPDWMRRVRKRNPQNRTCTGLHGHRFTPDVVWEDNDLRYVVELKRAPKYEPLSLTEVFHYVGALEQLRREGLLEKNAAPVFHAWKPLIPVILMQENYSMRAALPLIFAGPSHRWPLKYLEFDVLQSKSDSTKVLCFDDPFAEWGLVDDHSKAALPEEYRETPLHWYFVRDTDTYFGVEHPQPLRLPWWTGERVVRLTRVSDGFVACEAPATPQPTFKRTWSYSLVR